MLSKAHLTSLIHIHIYIYAVGAAKSLQLCPTLCDSIGGSPPGSPIPGILQQEHWSELPFASPMHESKSEVPQSCPTLRDPMDCNPPGSSVHSILQAGILEWVAMPSSRGSSPPRDGTHVSYVCCIGRKVLDHKRHLGSQSR